MTTSSVPRITFADRVALATGLAGMLAGGAVRRCCEHAAVDVEKLSPYDLARVLPHLNAILTLYLAPEEARHAMTRLRKLLPR